MAYTKERIHDIVLEQRKYFRTGETLDLKWRIRQLKTLKAAVLANKEMLQARKSPQARNAGARDWEINSGL